MFNIKIEDVESSNIDGVGYDKDNLTLVVKFKSGKAYSYIGVSPTIYKRLITAKSIGSEFVKTIKGNLGYVVIDNESFNFVEMMSQLKGLAMLNQVGTAPTVKQVKGLVEKTGILVPKIEVEDSKIRRKRKVTVTDSSSNPRSKM